MFEEITNFALLVPGFLFEILIAITCGGLVGLVRLRNKKTTNLRELILICIGTVLYINLSEILQLNAGEDKSVVNSQIISQLILAISIICTGYIVGASEDKKKFSTAILIWVVGAIGIIIGLNQWLLGLLITGIVLLVLTMLNTIAGGIPAQTRPLMLRVTVRKDTSDTRALLRQKIERENIQINSFRAENVSNGIKLIIQGENEPADIRTLISELWTLEGIIEIEH